MKKTGFKPVGGLFEGGDWPSYQPKPHWIKHGKGGGGRYNNLIRVAAAFLIFIVLLVLKESKNPWGMETRETLKHVLTTEWNYEPAMDKLVQYGLQVVNIDWSFFGSSQPVVSRSKKTGLEPALPLPVSGKVIRGFGMVIDPIDNMERFHAGIDIAAPVGSTVRAVQEGKVKRIGDSPVIGRYILLEHAEGSYTLYGELARVMVGEGQSVQAGQAIGEVGVTGDISGGGLHFEMRENNKLIDPLTRLRVNN